jgi:hypothetical protein
MKGGDETVKDGDEGRRWRTERVFVYLKKYFVLRIKKGFGTPFCLVSSIF